MQHFHGAIILCGPCLKGDFENLNKILAERLERLLSRNKIMKVQITAAQLIFDVETKVGKSFSIITDPVFVFKFPTKVVSIKYEFAIILVLLCLESFWNYYSKLTKK